jgi:hypothetical protein
MKTTLTITVYIADSKFLWRTEPIEVPTPAFVGGRRANI